MRTAIEQSTDVRRSSGLTARQYRVMGWFLIVLALVAGTIILVDFWKRLGGAAPLLTIACIMDVVAGGALIALAHRKAERERNG